MIELVVPLAITVLVVQNGQGFAVLKAAGHQPPVDAVTVACGVGAMLSAVVGSVSTCLTGPTNAIITSSGERSRHYTAGIFTGLLAVVFGLLSPAFTRLMLNAPKAFIMALAGPGHAARAAGGVRRLVQGPIHARCAGQPSW